MNRVEFIKQLRIALSGSVNQNIIEDNVRYYEDYLDMEIRKGKPEEQVLKELGSPRLIAKTIIETNKTAERENIDYDNAGSYNYKEEKEQKRKTNFFRIPLWLIGLGVVIVIILLFTVLTSIISVLLPIVLPMLVVVLIAKLVQSFWSR